MDLLPLEDIEAYVQVVALAIGILLLLIMGSVTAYIAGFGAILLSLVAVYLAVPFAVHYNATIQRHIIFMHRLFWRWGGSNFYSPSKHGIKGGRNVYVEDSSGMRVGVWHILPDQLVPTFSDKPEEEWDDSLSAGNPVIVYFHGNMGSRATGHRKELYKILQHLNYHVVAFDYSGFSDSVMSTSSDGPSKSSTLDDGLLVSDWAATLARGKAPIYFWGHSLGSGVSSLLLATLGTGPCMPVKGLILEAPFTSLRDVVLSHPFVRLYSFWPRFEWLFTGNLSLFNFDYESDICLQNTKLPIQILHSVNDPVIPYHIAEKLVSTLQKSDVLPNREIRLEKFDEFSATFAHAFICRSKKLPKVVEAFVESCSK